MGLKVVGAAVVLTREVGGDAYLYEGAPVGDGFTEASVAHAIEIGLVAEVEDVVDATEEESTDNFPDGEPTDAWTVKQLTAYAGTLEIDLGEAKKKDEILAVIVAAAAA